MLRRTLCVAISLSAFGLVGCVWTGPTEDRAEYNAIQEKPAHDPQPGAEGPTGPVRNGYSTISNTGTPTNDPAAQKHFDAPTTTTAPAIGPTTRQLP